MVFRIVALPRSENAKVIQKKESADRDRMAKPHSEMKRSEIELRLAEF